jgi:hypothetical protein
MSCGLSLLDVATVGIAFFGYWNPFLLPLVGISANPPSGLGVSDDFCSRLPVLAGPVTLVFVRSVLVVNRINVWMDAASLSPASALESQASPVY